MEMKYEIKNKKINNKNMEMIYELIKLSYYNSNKGDD